MCSKCKNKLGLSEEEFHRLYYKSPKKTLPSPAIAQRELDTLIDNAIFDTAPQDTTSKTIEKKHRFRQNERDMLNGKGLDGVLYIHRLNKAKTSFTPHRKEVISLPGRFQDQATPSVAYTPLPKDDSPFLSKAQQRRNEKVRATHFNTLAQFGTVGQTELKPILDHAGLRKRAAAKYYSRQYLQPLIDLDSPLKKSYLNTLFCTNEIIQNGNKITSSYCKNRWCRVCNRIRTAHLMNGYMSEVESIDDKYFVTLTMQNVDTYYLSPALDAFALFWKDYYESNRSKHKRNKGYKLKGIKKIECTYNAKDDSYHPHLHVLIGGEIEAINLLSAWMKFCEGNGIIADLKGQDIRPCDNKGVKELFKYFTKVATATGGTEKRTFRKGAGSVTVTRKATAIYIPPMDIIFQAMKGRRVYASFGIKKVDEDKPDMQAELVEVALEAVWRWQNNGNWYNTETFAPITDYLPSKYEREVSLKIIS